MTNGLFCISFCMRIPHNNVLDCIQLVKNIRSSLNDSVSLSNEENFGKKSKCCVKF